MTQQTATGPMLQMRERVVFPFPLVRLARSFGAEIALDLATVASGSSEHLLLALREHKLLLFRDQNLDEDAYIRVATELGKLWTVDSELEGNREQPHAVNSRVEIARVSNRDGMLQDRVVDWHGDLAHHPTQPYPGRILYAKALPFDLWSTTSWIDLEYGYERLLSDFDREELRGKRGEFRAGYVTSWAATERDVIQIHPARGSAWLGLDRAFFRRFVGIPPRESFELKRRILSRVLVPAATYQHKWRRGDVLIYDNEGTMHRREKVIGDGERTIWRVTLEYDWARLARLER